jgi:cholesterol transport system auxiliary component
VKCLLSAARGTRVIALLCALLSGCSSLLHSSAQPAQTYYLRAPVPLTSTAAATPVASAPVPDTTASLRVEQPIAGPGLDTAHIMLVQADHRMNFYAGSRWPAAAPQLIEALAVETLRGSGSWNSVQDSASPFPAQYLLQITLRRFDADYTGAALPVVQVVFDCTLGRREGREVIASFVAQGAAPAAADRMGDVVAAFEQATGAALTSLSQQVGAAVRERAQLSAQP